MTKFNSLTVVIYNYVSINFYSLLDFFFPFLFIYFVLSCVTLGEQTVRTVTDDPKVDIRLGEHKSTY